MSYKYAKIPLTASIAAPLMESFLRGTSEPIRRKDLIDVALSRHLELQGRPANGDLTSVGKKAIARLQSENIIEGIGSGYYRYCGGGENINEDTIDSENNEPEFTEKNDAQLQPEAEEVIGEGAEIVYLYFVESERRLASFEKRDVWPCKIGRTEFGLRSRIFDQGIRTSMVTFPTIGIIIKTDDSRRLERTIHFALDEADARIGDALGAEWFRTSPNHILDWYKTFQSGIEKLKSAI